MPSAQWPDVFEDRYGRGSLDRLLEQLQLPCVSFAEIAKNFGVSRERVRQWQIRLLPDAPRGHQRQQLCGQYRQKRRLLEDPVFRSFYTHARSHFAGGQIELVKARDGYRARAVDLDGRRVAIKDVSGSAKTRPGTMGTEYELPRHQGATDFIYYRLTADTFLFLAASERAAGGGTFVDAPGSRYAMFRNTFETLGTVRARHTA